MDDHIAVEVQEAGYVEDNSSSPGEMMEPFPGLEKKPIRSPLRGLDSDLPIGVPGPNDGGFYRHPFEKRTCSVRPMTVDEKEAHIEWLLGMLHVKSKHNISQSAFQDFLEQASSIPGIDPEIASMYPTSFRGLLSLLEALGYDYGLELVYDICPNCYIIYRGPNQNCTECPTVGCHDKDSEGPSERYEYDDKGKRTSRKQFCYRPIRQAIRQIFSCPTLAKLMTYHSSIEVDDLKTTSAQIVDVYDGIAYKTLMNDSEFSTEPRNAIIGLATDGVQPFKDDDQCSLWPIALTFYNLPPLIRYLLGCTTLVGIIPGKHSKEVHQDIIPFFELVCDELQYIHDNGIMVYDSSRGEEFNCKLKLLHVVSDLRGLESVFDLPPVPSIFACMKCWVRGYPYKGKTHYPGAGRNLSSAHPLREPLLDVPIHENLVFTNTSLPFSSKTQSHLKDGLVNMPPEIAAVEKDSVCTISFKNGRKRKHEGDEPEVGDEERINDGDRKRRKEDRPSRSPFFNLTDFNFTNVVTFDAMHTIGGVVKDTFITLLRKGRWNPNAEAFELEVRNNSFHKDTPWAASKSDLDIFTMVLKKLAAKCPSNEMGSRFERMFTAGKKARTHHYFVLASSFGQFMLHSAKDIAADQKLAYGKLLRACNLLCLKSYNSSDELGLLQELVDDALAHVELYLPATELDLKLHALHHMVDKIRIAGPSWGTCMFVYESLWGVLMRMGTNKNTVELTAFRNLVNYEFSYRSLLGLKDSRSAASIKLKDFVENKLSIDKMWLPHKVARTVPVPIVQIPNSGLQSNICLSHKDYRSTLLIDLHHLYGKDSDSEYTLKWDEFVPKWVDANKDLEPHDRTSIKNLKRWPSSRILSTAIIASGFIDLCPSIHNTVTLGNAEFCLESFNESSKDKHWALLSANYGADLLYVGRIQKIISHKGMDGQVRVICSLLWHEMVSVNDDEIYMPTFEASHTPDFASGNCVFAENLAPVNFIVEDHPTKENEIVILHRDPMIIQAAGYSSLHLYDV